MALGVSLQFAKGLIADAQTALNRALELAERVADADYQLRIINHLWVYHLRLGEIRDTLVLAHRAKAVAASLADPVAMTSLIGCSGCRYIMRVSTLGPCSPEATAQAPAAADTALLYRAFRLR